jgi:hypothetical protein
MSKKVELLNKIKDDSDKEEEEIEEEIEEEVEPEAEEFEDDEEVQIESEKKEKKLKANNNGNSLKRRKSLYEGFDENQKFFRPEYRFANDDPSKQKMWALMDTYLPRDKLNIQKKYSQTHRIYFIQN